MAQQHVIPDAWPLFLTREQLEAYLGMDYRTITMICPVQPLDFGNRVVRYHRIHIDAWAETLKTRLPKSHVGVNDTGPAPAEPEAEEVFDTTNLTSLDRVRARIEKGKTKCRKKA